MYFLRATYLVFCWCADGEPGRKSGNIRGEEVFSANRNTHLQNALQQNAVGRLRTGPVDRCDLNAEVI